MCWCFAAKPKFKLNQRISSVPVNQSVICLLRGGHCQLTRLQSHTHYLLLWCVGLHVQPSIACSHLYITRVTDIQMGAMEGYTYIAYIHTYIHAGPWVYHSTTRLECNMYRYFNKDTTQRDNIMCQISLIRYILCGFDAFLRACLAKILPTVVADIFSFSNSAQIRATLCIELIIQIFKTSKWFVFVNSLQLFSWTIEKWIQASKTKRICQLENFFLFSVIFCFSY